MRPDLTPRTTVCATPMATEADMTTADRPPVPHGTRRAARLLARGRSEADVYPATRHRSRSRVGRTLTYTIDHSIELYVSAMFATFAVAAWLDLANLTSRVIGPTLWPWAWLSGAVVTLLPMLRPGDPGRKLPAAVGAHVFFLSVVRVWGLVTLIGRDTSLAWAWLPGWTWLPWDTVPGVQVVGLDVGLVIGAGLWGAVAVVGTRWRYVAATGALHDDLRQHRVHPHVAVADHG